MLNGFSHPCYIGGKIMCRELGGKFSETKKNLEYTVGEEIINQQHVN